MDIYHSPHLLYTWQVALSRLDSVFSIISFSINFHIFFYWRFFYFLIAQFETTCLWKKETTKNFPFWLLSPSSHSNNNMEIIICKMETLFIDPTVLPNTYSMSCFTDNCHNVERKSLRTLFLNYFKIALGMYSHQESPLVHLLWSGPNTMLIFFVWCGSLSHCPFSGGPKIVNKTTRVLRSSVQWTEILKQGKTGSAKTATHSNQQKH